MIRAIAVDIDGTLTDQKRVLCPASVEAIRRLELPVVLVTGNTHCFTRTMAIALGTPFIFIAENGGVVSHADDDMELLADIKVCEAAYQELSQIFPLQKHDTRYRFTDIALKRDFDLEAASKYVKDRGLPVELIDTVFAVHIKEKGVDKGTGLRCIAERMSIGLDEFAAIGDSLSDIPMFEITGFRASVGNADPELKAISDYVSKARYGTGFAEIIEYMLRQAAMH